MEKIDTIKVELAYIKPDNQNLLKLTIPSNTTIKDAIKRSELLTHFPEIKLNINKVGVFNKIRNLDYMLKTGDRIEIYRPLKADPKEARRRRANKKKEGDKVTKVSSI